MNASVPDLAAYQKTFHERILTDFAGITAEELEIPSYFWEDELYTLRFRLHRYESHMRQHTVQIEKTLSLLGQDASEAQRLLRLVFAALAEAGGCHHWHARLEA